MENMGSFLQTPYTASMQKAVATLRKVGRIKHKPWFYDNSTSYSHSSDQNKKPFPLLK